MSNGTGKKEKVKSIPQDYFKYFVRAPRNTGWLYAVLEYIFDQINRHPNNNMMMCRREEECTHLITVQVM